MKPFVSSASHCTQLIEMALAAPREHRFFLSLARTSPAAPDGLRRVAKGEGMACAAVLADKKINQVNVKDCPLGYYVSIEILTTIL